MLPVIRNHPDDLDHLQYGTVVCSLLGPMAKDSTNFASIKPSSGTRSNETEVNDLVMSPACDMRIEMLLISCGDIELNPGPIFTCLTCASNFAYNA